MTINLFFLILISFVLGFILTIVPFPEWAVSLRPPWLLLTCFFWALARPSHRYLLVAFVTGIFLDALYGTLLGIYASAFVVSVYFIMRFQRYYMFYLLWQRLLMVFIGVVICQSSAFVLLGVFHYNTGFDWNIWLTPFCAVVIWPVITKILNKYHQKFLDSVKMGIL